MDWTGASVWQGSELIALSCGDDFPIPYVLQFRPFAAVCLPTSLSNGYGLWTFFLAPTPLPPFPPVRLSPSLCVLCLIYSAVAATTTTTTKEVMDGDMRRALKAGLADVGEEEEEDSDEEASNMLDDDFVMQAAGAGDVSAIFRRREK